MSTQTICDDCGEPLKVDEDHYQLTGSKVKEVDGALTVIDAPQTLHYHVEHLPVYKVGGQDITSPPVPTEPEAGEPVTEEPVEEPPTPEPLPPWPTPPAPEPETPVEG